MASLNRSRSSAFLIDSEFGADHFYTVLFQDALLGEIDGEIERGLTAQGREDRIRPFFGDNFFDDIGGDRLDISPIGEIRIGHDRRRIGVDQNDSIAFFLKSF